MMLAMYLRLDHVMAFHRLFWIPDGLDASGGVYVRYHAEDFYAILCLESHRNRCRLVGENLGTVPPEVNKRWRSTTCAGCTSRSTRCAAGAEDGAPSGAGELRGEREHAGSRLPPLATCWAGGDIDDRIGLEMLARGARASWRRGAGCARRW